MGGIIKDEVTAEMTMNIDKSKLIEAEFLEIEKNLGWNQFFQGIKSEMNNQPFEITEAKKVNNRKFNRYQDVNPFDHSRVILKNGTTDYINASIVPVEKADRKYILAQGPLSHTTPHFWQMVWQENSGAVIMLNRVLEKNVIKCHQYWPLPEEKVYVFNEVGLQVTYLSQERAAFYTITKLNLFNVTLQTSREIVHFHYTTWPDFGCPQSPTAFLKFLALVRASGALNRSDQPPVVHCSAGIGRSGTFCLVDSCLRLIKDVNLDNVVVRNVLIEMRHFRMGLVQTADQLRFSYLAIIEGLKRDITTNGTLEMEEKNEEIEGEDAEEEAPPVPPPRTESLNISKGFNDDTSEVEFHIKKKIDALPAIEKGPEESEHVILRRREREEKKDKLVDKIKEVTEKMKDSEDCSKGNRIKPAVFLALMLTAGCVLYWMYRR